MNIPQEHIDKIHSALNANGPMAVSGLIHLLTPIKTSSQAAVNQAIISAIFCPQTWRIDLSDDIGIVGLETQEKPADPAAYLGLVWMDCGEGSGCFVPKQILENA